MRKLDYNTPGSQQDFKVFKTNLQIKSKEELLLMVANVASACDTEGKGYISEWEDTVRHAIGYTRGHGEDHADSCGCPRCEKEHAGVYPKSRESSI
jgi:hypothetical protein